MPYFLVVYDQRAGHLLELLEFPSHRRAEALRARFDREAEELGDPHIEVVLLGAASKDALRRTHARYFKTVSEIAGAG